MDEKDKRREVKREKENNRGRKGEENKKKEEEEERRGSRFPTADFSRELLRLKSTGAKLLKTI